MTDCPLSRTESEVDPTPCGRGGSLKERRCQLFKLATLAILPGIILIVRDAVKVASDVQIVQLNREVKDSIMFSVEISAVVHAMQIERGTTALYVSSNGDTFVRTRLPNCYRETDTAFDGLSKWVSIDSNAVFQTKVILQRRIRDFRSNLDPLNTNLKQVIEFYSEVNAAFIAMIGRSLNLRKPFNFWIDLVSYQKLMISKEQAGIERALGSTYFAQGQLPSNDLLWYNEKRVLGLYFLQQSRQYSEFADSNMEALYDGTELNTRITLMQQHILDNAAMEPSVAAGAVWFDNMTEYINILNIVQDRLANKIIQAAEDENSSVHEALTISVLEFVIAIVLMPIIVILVRNIVQKIQNFSQELKEKTCELEAERLRTEGLLNQLLPRTVAKRLMKDGSALPESYNSATIMFSDVVGFTALSSVITPMQMVNLLNILYVTIDARLEEFDVYKAETIGDRYMIASGLPKRNGEKHVTEIAKLAIDLLATIETLHIPNIRNEKISLRVGFNTGPVVAGVVGLMMPRYCIFGDTVNTASRIASTGLPFNVYVASRIQMTESSAAKLMQIGGFIITERGAEEVMGKGIIRTFWLNGVSAKPGTNGAAYARPSIEENPLVSSNVTLISVKELPIFTEGILLKC
ncbi:speract receptor-like [Dreissena polymorpha]|uniref:speract receptor-like n=1 Tax=Dreissena polymorpha TaxID=45954 RepID=UPI0022649B24|nr:speract receptor-like [Dreissena polymorpha]